MICSANDQPRILFLDIETKPALVYSFGIRDQHLTHKQIAQDGGTICVGLKWLGQRKVTVFSEWEHGYNSMLRQVHEALSQCDAVATYNGARFDIPKLMGNFLLAGMSPPPSLTQIDIFKTVRKMGLICNKLDYIAPLLGVGSKMKHEGLGLWIKVMAGDERAQRKMARYCAQDVRLLEDVYNRVLAFIDDHPRVAARHGLACPNCGGKHLQSKGWRLTRTTRTQRLQCRNCGAVSKGRQERIAA